MRAALGEVATAGSMIERMEGLLAARTGRRVQEVRPSLARRVGTSAATLRHLRAQRRKAVPSWLFASIRRVLIEVLQEEMRELEHEIAVARQVGIDHRDDALIEAQAALATARALLQTATRSG